MKRRVCGLSRTPPGWWCHRDENHDGPCAAHHYLKPKDTLILFLLIVAILLGLTHHIWWSALFLFGALAIPHD